MGTFATIQARVLTRVIDAPAGTSGEIPTLINEAMKTLQVKHNFKVMEKVLTANTVLNTRTLVATKPTDWKEPRPSPYWEPFTNGKTGRMEWVPDRESAHSNVTTLDKGAPKYLLEGEPTTDAGVSPFEVWPLPDGLSDYSDGEYRVYIPYWRFLPDLSAGSDTNWFTVNAEEYLVHAATGMAFALDWDENRLAEWGQLGAGKAQEVIKRDKMLRVSSVTTLVPHHRGVLSPRARR